MYFRIALSILALFTSLIATQAWAGAKEKVFFDSVSGVWRGPGKIVAGKYKGSGWSLPRWCLLTENVGDHQPEGRQIFRSFS